jgi:hypothetical protein
MDYVTIMTQGNAADFGDISANTNFVTGASNSIRGLRMGGATPSVVNIIEYVTMASVQVTQQTLEILHKVFKNLRVL